MKLPPVLQRYGRGFYIQGLQQNFMSKTSRIFIGIGLDEAAQNFLDQLTQQIKVEQPQTIHANTRWTLRENRHITLCFLGEVANKLLPSLKTGLTAISQSVGKSKTEIFSINTFPGNESHLIAAELVATEALEKLQLAVQRMVGAQGLPTEQRRYRPHITLCRNRLGFKGFAPIEIKYPITLDNIILYHSKPKQTGSQYIALQTTPLTSL
ncbi:RNA 2',3'-cyclic phosphodiesterase [Microbulbifer sp. SSSA002]|uniref:RNA 2',3'-cyclic phosphodiesterase n=1 Tax=unclassified Microbulbifer TaxID=2619833 RepID=UPI0040395BA5